jgi:hypothetical protein
MYPLESTFVAVTFIKLWMNFVLTPGTIGHLTNHDHGWYATILDNSKKGIGVTATFYNI